MSGDKYIVRKDEIEAMPGLDKTHFLNKNAKRKNKSLGDLTGLTGLGFHIVEIAPGDESTEFHVHYHEDECTYVLSGTGTVVLGAETHQIGPGDFIGYRKGGLPHTMRNTGPETLRCIVVGQRLDHDMADYPNRQKRIFRQAGFPANVVEHRHIEEPSVGAKS